MKEVNTDLLLQEVSSLLDRLRCDYLLALFPSDESGCKTASIGMHLEDIDGTALLLSKILLEGGDLGWNLLLMLQKTCRNFPVPLTQLLAANEADYKALIESLGKQYHPGIKSSSSSVFNKEGNELGGIGGGRRK